MVKTKPEKTLIRAVERYLPKHLMAYCADSVTSKGLEFREDINQALIVGAASDITSYDPKMMDAISKTMDSFMPGIVRTLPDTPQKALLAASLFLMKLVDRGLYSDPRTPSVLTAVLLLNEAEEDAELWGGTQKDVEAAANNLITFCNLKGIYLTTPIL